MAITGTQATASPAFGVAQAAKGSNKQMDMNAFLTMFTTQLKYQDPNNPLESYELASQLAQFTSVEKLTEMNSRLAEANSYLSSINSSQMLNALGKEVVGSGDSIRLENGQVSKGFYDLEAPCQISVQIYDEKGNLLRTMERGVEDAGRHVVEWDGKNDAGQGVPEGTYRFEVSAVGQDGKSVSVNPGISGTAFSFRMESGTPYLILNGANGPKLPIGDLVEVQNGESAS